MKDDFTVWANKVKRFLNSEECLSIMKVDHKKGVFKVLDIIESHYDPYHEGYIPSEQEVKDIKEVAHMIFSVLEEIPISEDISYFILSLIHVLSTWNGNVWKDADFLLKLQYLERHVKNELTISESIVTLDKSAERLRGTVKGSNPPSLKISEHYFNLLEGE